jgi:hypothetical protein
MVATSIGKFCDYVIELAAISARDVPELPRRSGEHNLTGASALAHTYNLLGAAVRREFLELHHHYALAISSHLLTPPTQRLPNQPSMLRQVLSVPSRAARSSLRQIPVARPQFYQIPAISSRIAQPSVTRWYSAEAESTPKEGEAAKEPEASDPVAELKKQLEAKEAEVRDWKVCRPRLFPPLQ